MGLSADLLAVGAVLEPPEPEWGDPPAPRLELCPRLRTSYSPRSAWWDPSPRVDPSFRTDLAWCCGTGFLTGPGSEDCGSPDPEGPAALGLSLAERSKKQGREGLKGITGAARRSIFRSLSLLEENRRLLVMHTVTLPDEALTQLARLGTWPAFQDRYRQELIRRLRGAGLPALVVGVVELQPDRSRAQGRPCPHLHTVFQGRQPGEKGWRIPVAVFDEVIRSALETAGVFGVDLRSAGEVAPIRKSVRAYLACYLTKKQVDPAPWVGGEWESLIPRRWWFWSRPLRAWVVEHILPVSLAFIAWVHLHRGQLAEIGAIRWREIVIPDPRAPRTFEVDWISCEALAALVGAWLEDEWDAEWGRSVRRNGNVGGGVGNGYS